MGFNLKASTGFVKPAQSDMMKPIMTPNSLFWRPQLEASAEWSFARSSGPGGQNVNKVNTKVLLRLPLAALTFLSETQIQTVREKLASRIVDDALTLHVQDRRSQFENRELALDRAADLILQALTPVAHRHKTRPTKASRERRLTAKKRLSGLKRNRSASLDD